MSPTVTSIVALHGYLAPLASIGCFLAPYATIRVVAAEKRVRSLPLLPYSSMIISSFLWTTYGLLVREPKIWASNMVGVTCAMYYAHVFTQYCPAAASTLPGSVRAHIRGILAIVIATLVIAIVAPINVATYVIGKAGVVFCMAMFASPLAALRTVLEQKSAASIPLPFTVAATINCWLWSICGLFELHDPNIYYTNIPGLLFGLIQLALKVAYPDKKGKHSPVSMNSTTMVVEASESHIV